MQPVELTAERLREMLHYDLSTGRFVWRQRSGSTGKAGATAGTVDGRGYIRIGLDHRVYRAHRLAWLYVHGEWPAGEIDHINGDKQNNRLVNLRVVSRSENQQNLRTAHRRNSSDTLGVSLHIATGKWRARIWTGGRNKSLGLFPTKEQAHARYVEAKRELHTGATL